MRSIGSGLRSAYLAAGSRPAQSCARRAAGRSFLVALAVLLAALLAAPRAEAEAPLDYFMPTLRIDLGSAWRFQQEGALPALALNVNAGVIKGTLSPVIVLAEIGYSYTHQHTHAFTAGAGVGSGLPFIAMGYLMPRLVVGTDDGRTAVGMRTGLSGMFFYDIFTFEVAHQFLSAGAGLAHEARLSFGINIGSIVALAAMGVGL